MIERRRSTRNVTMCPACGAHMRAATVDQPGGEPAVFVWRCIRCGGETPRLARRTTDGNTDDES